MTGKRSEIARHIDIVRILTAASYRRLMAYPIDFGIGLAGFLIQVGLSVLVLVAVFGQVNALAGWTLNEAMFLLGTSMTTKGFDHCFTDQLWELARKLVQRGEFVRYLIRPAQPLVMLLSERFLYPDGIGELLGGLMITVVALVRLAHEGMFPSGSGRWICWAALMLCGTLVYSSTKLILASCAFWTTTSFNLMTAIYHLFNAAQYPLTVFPFLFKVILTGVVPVALTGYVPADVLLHGFSFIALVTPFITFAFVALAFMLWAQGIHYFEAVGG